VAARVLGPGALGRQSFIAYVELSLIAILSGGISGSLMRYVGELSGSRRPGAAGYLVSRAWRIAAGTGLIGAVILAGVGLAGADPRAAWLLAAVVCLTSVLQTIPSAVLVGLQRWRDATVAGLVVGAGGMGLTVLVLGLGGGITGMFAAEVASAAAGLLWTAALARRAGQVLTTPRERPEPALRRAAIRYALAASVSVVLSLVVWTRSEFFFLQHYSTTTEIAFYSIAFAVVNALIRLPSAAATVFTPAVANLFGAGAHDRIQSGYGRALRLLVVVTLPCVAMTLALGPTAVKLIWGDDYAPAGDVLLILAASSTLVPFTVLSAAVLGGLRRIRAPVAADVVAAGADVGLAFALVPGHGAIGAALANAGAQVTAGLIITTSAVQAVGGIRLDPGSFARVVLAAAAGGGAAWATQHFLSELPGLIGGLAAGCAVLAVVAAGVGVLREDDARWLEDSAGPRLRKPVGRLARRVSYSGAQTS
jgi:O-antigen/teichoic acid export membrane protein